MIFAQNFDQVRAKNDAVLLAGGSPGETGTFPGGRPGLQLQWDEPVPGPLSPSPRGTARLLLSGGGRCVKGIHAEIRFDPKHWELESAEPGSLLTEGVFARSYGVALGCVFDAAAMGGATTLPDDGEVAILRFRALAHDAVAGGGSATRIATKPSSLDLPELLRYELRGVDNRSLAVDESPVPAADLLDAALIPAAADPRLGAAPADRGISFLEARPNPTAGSTEIRLVLSRTIHTELRIHDVTGRAVKARQRGVMPAGEHSLRWDGTGPHGRRCGSGTYFCVVRTPDDMRVVKLHLIE
jgi:hypothetical protein